MIQIDDEAEAEWHGEMFTAEPMSDAEKRAIIDQQKSAAPGVNGRATSTALTRTSGEEDDPPPDEGDDPPPDEGDDGGDEELDPGLSDAADAAELDQLDPEILRFEQELAQTYDEAGQAALEDLDVGVNFRTDLPQQREWLRNKVIEFAQQTSDTTIARVKAELLDGMREGETIQQLAARVREAFDGRKANALTVARTETVGTINRARIDSYEQAGIASHQWVTQRDDHVRDSHAEMDGEIVDLDEPFSNGLYFPGDTDNGEPADFINCRCDTWAVVPGSHRRAIVARLREWNEDDHPRDEDGKFGDGSGSGQSGEHEETVGHPQNPATSAAVSYYTGSGYVAINQSLRDGDESREDVKHIDAAIAREPERTMEVYRGISGSMVSRILEQAGHPPLAPPSEHNPQVMSDVSAALTSKLGGVEIVDRGFVSTTRSEKYAKTWIQQYAKGIPAVMKITGRTRALDIDSFLERRGGEDEELLPRGIKFKITDARLKSVTDRTGRTKYHIAISASIQSRASAKEKSFAMERGAPAGGSRSSDKFTWSEGDVEIVVPSQTDNPGPEAKAVAAGSSRDMLDAQWRAFAKRLVPREKRAAAQFVRILDKQQARVLAALRKVRG